MNSSGFTVHDIFKAIIGHVRDVVSGTRIEVSESAGDIDEDDIRAEGKCTPHVIVTPIESKALPNGYGKTTLVCGIFVVAKTEIGMSGKELASELASKLRSSLHYIPSPYVIKDDLDNDKDVILSIDADEDIEVVSELSFGDMVDMGGAVWSIVFNVNYDPIMFTDLDSVKRSISNTMARA